MVIGVDAGALSIQDDRLKVGVWRVTGELLKELACIDVVNTYRLYSFLPLQKETLDSFPKFTESIVLKPSIGFMKFRIPCELLLRPVDVFLGLSQALPSMRKGKRIGFIYDLGFRHDTSSYEGTSASLNAQTKNLVATADTIITISQSIKQDIMKQYRLDGENIRVVYPGVSDVFTQRQKRYDPGYPYFLYVGSLRKGKNIVQLIRAFDSFIKRFKTHHHLVLAGGDYWNDPAIQLEVMSLGLQERIHLTGHVSDEALSSYYQGAEAFITLSLSEGFCIPVAEALSSGCPVIASNIPTLEEVIGDAGILVDTSNTDEVIQAIRDITTNKKLQTTLIEKGKIRSTKYSWKTFAKGVISTYSL